SHANTYQRFLFTSEPNRFAARLAGVTDDDTDCHGSTNDCAVADCSAVTITMPIAAATRIHAASALRRAGRSRPTHQPAANAVARGTNVSLAAAPARARTGNSHHRRAAIAQATA